MKRTKPVQVIRAPLRRSRHNHWLDRWEAELEEHHTEMRKRLGPAAKANEKGDKAK